MEQKIIKCIVLAGWILPAGVGQVLDQQTHLFPHLLQLHRLHNMLRYVLHTMLGLKLVFVTKADPGFPVGRAFTPLEATSH